jgi:hypothetical protein
MIRQVVSGIDKLKIEESARQRFNPSVIAGGDMKSHNEPGSVPSSYSISLRDIL